MTEFDELTITRAVIDRLGGTSDDRLRQVTTAMVRHLHAFVAEVRPTFDEWRAGVEFLTRVGQSCTETRQEFILLSDTLGVSTLVDALSHSRQPGATASTILGPFYVENPPRYADGSDIAFGIPGEPLFVEMQVLSLAGKPIADAIIDVWQSDAEGWYDVQKGHGNEHSLRGSFQSDAAGRFRFWSIMPASYPIPDDGPVGQLLRATGRHPYRPAHIHFRIAAPGYRTLVTHLFVEGDPYLQSDAVFAVKESLVRTFASRSAGQAPDGRSMEGPWRLLRGAFSIPALDP